MTKASILLMLVFALPVVADEQEIAQDRARILSFDERLFLYQHPTNTTGLLYFDSLTQQDCVDVVQTCVRLAGVETNKDVLRAMSSSVARCGDRMMRASKGGWCTNDTFLSSLLAYYVAKRDSYSDRLDQLASPRWLNRHAELLKPYALSTTNQYLCMMLDSISRDELRNISPSNSLAVWPLWALARKGDTNAEDQLLTYAIVPTISLPQGVRLSGEDIGNSGSEKLLRLAARELRSEEYDRCMFGGTGGDPGGVVTVMKRRIWAEAIRTAMRNEESPETPHFLDWDDDNLASFDPLEKWCTRKFGIEYPATPRKRLPYYGIPEHEAMRLARKFAMVLRANPPRVVLPGFDYREIALTNLNAWVVANREKAPEWWVTVSGTLPIDTAITLIDQFGEYYGKPYLSFASGLTERMTERVFVVALIWDDAKDATTRQMFRLRTSIPNPYSEVLDKYGRRRMSGTNDWYECESSVDVLEKVLPILMKGVPSIDANRTLYFECDFRDRKPFAVPQLVLDALQTVKKAGFKYVGFWPNDRHRQLRYEER